jgi:hypothetical protein
MNKGVEIILKRIETHPEEFCFFGDTPCTKWHNMILVLCDPEKSGSFVSEEERELLQRKLGVVTSEAFTQQVLAVLTRDDSSGRQLPLWESVALTSSDSSISGV